MGWALWTCAAERKPMRWTAGHKTGPRSLTTGRGSARARSVTRLFLPQSGDLLLLPLLLLSPLLLFHHGPQRLLLAGLPLVLLPLTGAAFRRQLKGAWNCGRMESFWGVPERMVARVTWTQWVTRRLGGAAAESWRTLRHKQYATLYDTTGLKNFKQSQKWIHDTYSVALVTEGSLHSSQCHLHRV